MSRDAFVEAHRGRVVDPVGVVHAAPRAVGGGAVLTACVLDPVLVVTTPVEDTRPLTCAQCVYMLSWVITCPVCKTPGAAEFGAPVPGTDDTVDCARCVSSSCGHEWALDPGADAACTECGGSGRRGRGGLGDPQCSCGDLAEFAAA